MMDPAFAGVRPGYTGAYDMVHSTYMGTHCDQRNPSAVRAAWLLTLVLSAAGQVAAAQDAPATAGRFSIDVAGLPLDEALARFQRATGIGVIVASDLIANQATTCRIENASAEECLRCILDGTGLSYDRYASGTLALTRPNVSADSAGASGTTGRTTLSGFVRDSDSGEGLIGATLYDLDRKLGATTNAYVFYSLTLPSGRTRLLVSYLGFEHVALELELHSDRELNVELAPASLSLDTLTVVGARVERIEAVTQMSVSEVPVSQIQSMPALLGEVDVLRAIQLLPGVQSGNEGNAGLYVRGGSPDQNLILIDGAPVYNASHLFGFLSVFNADAMRNVQLTKGGFPARYGGRLSSVLEMSMKEGNDRRYAGAFSLGVVSAHGLIEGPIVRNRSSFMVAARRSFVDLVVRPFVSDMPGYYLYDINAKVNYTFSRRDRLYASLYTGADRFIDRQRTGFDVREGSVTEESVFELSWGNTLSTLRWNHLFSNKLFSNVLVLFSDYRFGTRNREDTRFRTQTGELHERIRLDYASGVRDVGVRFDVEYQPGPAHYIRIGASSTRHRYQTGALQYREQRPDAALRDTALVASPHVAAGEVTAYVEDDMRLASWLSANAGVHLSAFMVEGTRYASVEPRLSMRIRLPGAWALKASYARMTQYLHLLTNAGIGLPTDLWVPSTARVAPQRALQVAAGIARTLGDFEVSVEAYHKQMRHLIEYSEGAGFLGIGTNWEQNVSTGRGRAHGVEFFVQKKAGRTTGWLGYTLSRSDRTFEALNFGRTFPFKFDRRHDLAVTLQHALSGRWRLSATWVYGTGNTVTLPTARYLANGVVIVNSPNNVIIENNTQYDYIDERNGTRMRPFHRLDLGAQYAWEKGGRDQRLSFSVYNAYNRLNPFFYFRDDVYESVDTGGVRPGLFVRTTSQIRQQSLFPILPSVSYHLSF